MEFKFDLSASLKHRCVKSFGESSTPFGLISECMIVKLLPSHIKPSSSFTPNSSVNDVIDKMGDLSALAQGLHMPITSAFSFKTSEYTIYMKIHSNRCLGFIKTGFKNLYVREYSNAKMVNIKPLCILDFYVYEKCQREGHGKDLFDCVLTDQKIEPKDLAYDRPSHKFLSFLKKHFGLCDYFPQNNNFVVFNEFFGNSNNEFDMKGSNGYKERNRRDQVVFKEIGSQMLKRSESVQDRALKAYSKPTYSQLDIHKTYQFSDSKILYSFILDNEELKVATPSKTNRYENKFENYKERAYVTPKMMGIEKPGPVPDPRPNKCFKFCLGEKNNKLLNRVVKNTDYLDLYTSKVDGSNSRVNANLQSKRAVGYQSIGLVSPTNNVSKAPQNLLLQKYGRDSLLRIPLQNHP